VAILCLKFYLDSLSFDEVLQIQSVELLRRSSSSCSLFLCAGNRVRRKHKWSEGNAARLAAHGVACSRGAASGDGLRRRRMEARRAGCSAT